MGIRSPKVHVAQVSKVSPLTKNSNYDFLYIQYKKFIMDFNCRSPKEELYIDEKIMETPLDVFLQEIDIILSTEYGSVMGNRNLGHDIERLLWQTTYNAEAIESTIRKQIEENSQSNSYFKWSVQFQIMRGDNSSDIGILTVNISDKNNNTTLSNQNYVFK